MKKINLDLRSIGYQCRNCNGINKSIEEISNSEDVLCAKIGLPITQEDYFSDKLCISYRTNDKYFKFNNLWSKVFN